MDVVKACPSGALRFSLPGEAPQHSLPAVKGVRVEKDGPYRVTGGPLVSIRLAKKWGHPYGIPQGGFSDMRH